MNWIYPSLALSQERQRNKMNWIYPSLALSHHIPASSCITSRMNSQGQKIWMATTQTLDLGQIQSAISVFIVPNGPSADWMPLKKGNKSSTRAIPVWCLLGPRESYHRTARLFLRFLRLDVTEENLHIINHSNAGHLSSQFMTNSS